MRTNFLVIRMKGNNSILPLSALFLVLCGGYRESMNKLDIGTRLTAVGIACTLLTTGAIALDWVALGRVALDWVALDRVALDRIALLWYWASH